MSSKRWDKDEKARLIHLFSEGKSFTEIAEKLNRSESAIRLRLQTIAYDGIAKGMRAADLADTLKADTDTVIQMFYTHRDFKESRGEEVISLEAATKLLFGQRKGKAAPKNRDDISELLNDSKSSGSSKSKSKSSEVDRLTEQNRIMEAIINNRDLRKKIKKLYKDGKLSEEEKALLEVILS
jgi:DNA-binding Lrp family transcriptional regulator